MASTSILFYIETGDGTKSLESYMVSVQAKQQALRTCVVNIVQV